MQVQNLLHIESQREPCQSFPGGASTTRASLCVLEGHGTTRGGTLGGWAGALEGASPSLASTTDALLPEGTFAPPVWSPAQEGRHCCTLHPGAGSLRPSARHFVLPTLLRARCGLCSAQIRSGILR